MFNEKVMIVDTNQHFLSELEETLALSGYFVSPFISHDVLFNSLLFVKPDVILMDISPEDQGIANRILSIKENPDTTFISIIAMLDHLPSQKELGKMSYCGIDTYIKKPFRPLDVITRIEHVLSQRREYIRAND
ncbi:MAG TPA: response regulator [Candidatus Omnitrophota bacterium]|nr:response regulator [Candidatus Omnitrophota bacterium]HPT06906.1 response regulator [Candidatus Omnitrophota bacterium]